jgi:hypothetical protein
MDRISAKEYELNNGTVHVNKLVLLNDAERPITLVPFADEELRNHVSTDITEAVYSPIWKYKVDYLKDSGEFMFSRPSGGDSVEDFNPGIVASSVAEAATLYAMQTNFHAAFPHMDRWMLLSRDDRLEYRLASRYATDSFQTGPFSLAASHDSTQGWFRPNAMIERVDLNGMAGNKINNTTYGAFFGTDTKLKELRRGWARANTYYAGYSGARQSYMEITNLQNGALLGATSQFYKKDFFAGITANVGYMYNNASTMFGNDEFSTIYAGTAVRFGNNFEKGKFILQPNMTVGYGFANTFDYKTASSIDITSNPLHTIHLSPELKVIANLKNGWQPYAGVSAIWNVASKSSVYANNVQLPELNAKPYVQYNLGVQKAWNERYSSYLQATARSGGRTGIGFSAGLNIALGRDYVRKERKEKQETL